MSTLIPFQFESHALRVQVDEVGQPWFNASDACAALELGNPRQALDSHVDSEDVQKLDTLTPGGRQRQNHVNESGLYALILGSTKDAAKRFKRWVTSEVLPAIRKTGTYSGAPVTYRRGIGLRLTMLSVSNSTYYAVPVPGDSKSFYLVASATDVSDASKRLAISLTTGGFYDAGASVRTAVANAVAGTRYQSGNTLSVTGGGSLTVSEVNYIQNQLVFASPHGLSDGAEVTYSAANPDLAIKGMTSGQKYYVKTVPGDPNSLWLFPKAQDVDAAAGRLAPYMSQTPLIFSAALSDLLGAEVWLKLETASEIACFKLRGRSEEHTSELQSH